MGIIQNLSTVFHPRTDGQSEHMNQWIETYLRQFTNGQQTNWATYLPIAEFAYNSWKHKGTCFTPHYLIMGCNCQANWIKGDKDIPAVEERLNKLTKAREQAHQSLQCKTAITKTIRMLLDSLGCSGQCLENLERSRHNLDCPGCSGHSLEHFRLCLWQGTVRTMPHMSFLCCRWSRSHPVCVLFNIMSQTHPLCLDLLQRSRLIPQSYSLLCRLVLVSSLVEYQSYSLLCRSVLVSPLLNLSLIPFSAVPLVLVT